MIAELPTACPQVCSAGREVIQRSNREGLCAWLRVSEDTIGRMMTTDNASRWTDQRIAALQKYEEVVLKSRTIRNARMAALETKRIGNPFNVEKALFQDIGIDAASISKENAILADGRADVAELKALLPDIDREVEALLQLRADIVARIAQEGGR